MLVITRLPGQTIHVGEDVVITISEVQGKKVRVGIDAPRTTAIWRGELDDKVEGGPGVREEEAVTVG